MKQPVFTGTCTALITPFRESGSVDYGAFAKQMDRQIEAGVDAMCVCGTTGESAALSMQEHIHLVEFCVSHIAGRCKVLAGSGSNDTATALSLCQHAQEAGADALLVVTPYYNKTTQSGLVKHYLYLADQVKTPLILYNVPSRTGLSFSAETYQILSQHPNINGAKEASGDFSLIARTITLCGDDLNLWSGNDDQAVPLLSLGAKGLISVASNLIPKTMTELTRSWLRGDTELARALQLKHTPLFSALFSQVNPIPIKAAMAEAGLDSGVLRLPLTELDAAARRDLISVMKSLDELTDA